MTLAVGAAAIVGAGQAGSALAHGLRRVGVPVVAITSRREAAARALAGAVGAEVVSLDDAVQLADLVLVTTPDHAVADVVARIAERGDLAGKTFLHCSGVLDLEVLDSLARAGARVGILHPVTPLIPPELARTLSGKPMGCDAEDPAWVAELAQALGGRPIDLRGVSRPLYHAAASMAANLVVGLVGAAARVFREAGVSPQDADELVGSLLTTTAENVSAHGPEGALTGPARRGDAEVLRAHLGALGAVDPELADTYRTVSRRILDLMPPGSARERSSGALG